MAKKPPRVLGLLPVPRGIFQLLICLQTGEPSPCIPRVNREARQDKQEQWVDVTVTKKDGNNGAVKLHCGNLTISVEPGFNPALLLDILKVVQALC